MKKTILLSCLMLITIAVHAQECSQCQKLLPNRSIFLTAGAVYNGGFETTLGTEHFFSSNHTVSLYGAVGYLNTTEKWNETWVECNKVTAEIGGRCYIPAVKNRFYPFVGVGIVGGVQGLIQKQTEEDVINESCDPYMFGGACTIGLEYMVSRNAAIEVHWRAKYINNDRHNHVFGGSVKFYF